jgi:uncharacterized protein YidB (DUF937 family)
MGLLDGLLGKLSGNRGGTEQVILNAVTGLLADKNAGGLSGLVDQFSKSGLGDVVSSWVGTGSNLPVSPDQIAKAFGKDKLGQMAQQTGLSHSDLTSALASALPGIVDKLTPQGKIPTDDLLQQGLSFLKGKL